MMKSSHVLMIYPEKPAVGKRFLPIGFYIASSILSHNGFVVECLDLSFYDDYKSAISNKIQTCYPDMLGFSICSHANYKYALDIIRELSLEEDFPIVFGGQHMQPPTEKENGFYKAIIGDLERIESFFDRNLFCSQLETIDYSLVPFVELYYPSLEISRGCWNHCQFCNSDNRYIEKDTKCIENELQKLSSLYPRDTILTLAGSNHLFRNWRKKGLMDVLLDYSKYFRFNFNLGIESDWESEWDTIIRLNLWNIFAGIESCDEDTLLRMQKSKTPQLYIKKASEFLHRCKTDGIYLFATYIYGYPGQTLREIDKLDDFFIKHSCNNIIQIGFPCEAYPGTKLLTQRKRYEQLGVKYNKVYAEESIEFFRLDISQDLRYDYLSKRSKKMYDIVNAHDLYTINRCKGKMLE